MSKRVTTLFDPRTTASEILDGVDLSGRRFIVTGGGSGLGLETTRALAEAGGHVTVGARNLAAAQKAVSGIAGVIDVKKLHLDDLSNVQAFVETWEGPLHGVIANAGVMAIPERRLTASGWEMQLATNYLGHFALLHGLHDGLTSAGDARVVTVSSTAHLRSPFQFDDPHFEHRPYDRWAAYAQSKTADVLLAVGVAATWANDGIIANSLMPGWITTNLQRHLDDDTLRAMGALDDAGNRVEQDFFKTLAQGAATSVLLAASPIVDGVTGRYFEDNQEAEQHDDGEGHTTGVARYALDHDNAARLWTLATHALQTA